MSVSVVSEPTKSNGNITNCRMLGVTQALYKFLRRDNDSTNGWSLASGERAISMNTDSQATLNWVVGDVIWIEYEDNATGDRVEVTAPISSFAASNTVRFLATDIPTAPRTTAGADTYMNNLSNNWRLKIRLGLDAKGAYYNDPTTDPEFFYNSKANGDLNIDLAERVRRYITNRSSSNNILIYSRKYSVHYTEVTRDGEGSESDVISGDEYSMALGKFQYSGNSDENNGSNYIDFGLYSGNTKPIFATYLPNRADEDEVSGFAWRGWGYSYFWPILNAPATYDLTLQQYNADGTPSGSPSSYNSSNTNEGLIRRRRGIQISSSAKTVEAILESGATQYGGKWTREILDECPNPVMIEWRNELGGFDQWMFSYNQEVAENATEGLVYDMPITEDIEEGDPTDPDNGFDSWGPYRS